MKKLTWALLSLMLFLGLGAAFADEGVTVTLNPASGETVSDGTPVTITLNIPDGYTVNGVANWGLAETKAEAEAMNWMDLEDYADAHKPVITAGKTVLKVRVVGTDADHKSFEVIEYGEYTLEVGDIASPYFTVNADPVMSYDVTPDAMIGIQCGEGTGCERWYTTDGSTPEKDGATSHQFTQAFEIGSVLEEGAESVTIKAIVVDGEKTSAVVMAEFHVAEVDAHLVLMDMGTNALLTETYGKYVELMPMIMLGEAPAMGYQLYYTNDGKTEPSEEYKGEDVYGRDKIKEKNEDRVGGG
ncbi:MAG: chitobiase/beta-hexosaminidase C-terminal domain-containing protein, partial [Bacteroidales bacterium]|nr:chitobiase/beta-hexosaminidase C-terminal domain-containing protein [Bacteroidales bacterium]